VSLAFFLALVLGASHAMAQTAAPLPRPIRKGSKYSVKIDSSPQQAAIYLDDKQYGIVGYTPFEGKLVKGDYRLVLVLPGYKEAERIVRIERTSRDFFVPLERKILPAIFDVQATADPNVNGAQVYVDGQLQGNAPTVAEVPEGRHLIEIKKAGFTDFSQWLTVAQGQKATLAPVLKPVVVEVPKGSVLVDADVADAEVYVDGRLLPDKAPTLLDNLDEGSHIIEVKKPPAQPWKQTVYVKGGQRTKVIATLAPTVAVSQGGTVRVLSNVNDAEVWLDGALKGKVPADLADVAPGAHIIEVKAPGYQSRHESVTVNTGQSVVLKLDLPVVDPAAATNGKIKVVSPVPEAKVFIDGASVGTVPVEKEASAGEHFVTVQQVGYAKFEQKIVVEATKVFTVTAELRAIGTLRFLSNVEGAEVVLDGQVIGKTPLVKDDVDVGEHVVTMRQVGYRDFEEAVKVEGGKTAIVNADLRKINTGPTAEEIVQTTRGLSSFGARVIPSGRFTVDLSGGYPYWMEGRATVGVKDAAAYGWDLGVTIRSMFTTWEILGMSRFRFFQREPFSFAAFAAIGAGGGLEGRNQFSVMGGLLASLTLRNLVTITGRGYLSAWRDQLCQSTDDLTMQPEGKQEGGPTVCQTDHVLTVEEEAQVKHLIGDTKNLRDADVGVRAYLSFIAEAAVHQRFSIFLLFEGAPFQAERAAFTNVFNGTLLTDKDPIYNGRLGITFKF
jgi:hypothetical protein